MTDALSGETVAYQYDSLNRLISAAGSGWTQTQSYDGFGNLTGRVGTGTAQSTTMSTPADAATNRLSGYSYDANGNLLSTGNVYDAENRLGFANISGGMVEYFYDAQNKRIWQGTCTAGGSCQQGVVTADTITLFGADGRQIATYQWSAGFNNTQTQVAISFQAASRRAYFGGKLVAQSQSGVMLSAVQDRLGSVGKYYPYGEERNSPPLQNDQVKFATYTRDSGTGLDYADQRYYASTFGRFMTPDPYSGSAKAPSPLSWNRYVYAANDPVNNNDPRGLDEDVPDPGCYVSGIWIPGCDIGWPPTAFVPQTAWSRAIQRLNSAINAFEDRSSFSQKCQNDIDAIAAAAPGYIDKSTITIGAIQEALIETNFQNGVGSTVSQSVLYPTSPQAAAIVANLTIGALFGDPSKLTTAVTTLGGRTIYIDPSLISGSLTKNEGLLMHEALHELGLDDSAIGAGLSSIDKSIKPDANGNWTNTKQFSDKLTKDCFTGKDNKN